MLQEFLSNEDLVEYLRHCSRQEAEARQLVRRLKDLWDLRLREILAKVSAPTQAQRLRILYTSHDYARLVEEYTNLLAESHKLRAEYQTHYMLFMARKSNGR